MLSSPANPPAHEMVYRQIRDKILFGDLTPGQAVTIQGLVAECGVSMTPVREAIRRLTAEGALELQGNRRVLVPRMTEPRFAELTYARDRIEPRLAEMAAVHIGEAVIGQLRQIDDALNAAIDLGDVKGYMRQNYRFHFTLYGQAGSTILLPMAESLWLRFGPLYRIISGKYGTESLIDRHDEAILALGKGDARACARAIRADIGQGFSIIRESFGWSEF